MSVESAKAFYERIATDEAFRTQHRNAATDDERREIVLAAGYNFTLEEWQSALAQISESSNGELSEAELTTVSGGVTLPILPILPKIPPMSPLYGVPFLDDPLG